MLNDGELAPAASHQVPPQFRSTIASQRAELSAQQLTTIIARVDQKLRDSEFRPSVELHFSGQLFRHVVQETFERVRLQRDQNRHTRRSRANDSHGCLLSLEMSVRNFRHIFENVLVEFINRYLTVAVPVRVPLQALVQPIGE